MSDSSDYGRNQRNGRNRKAGGRQGSEFQQAVDRLEQAVQDLVGSATSEFSDKATTFLNETTSKLEREFRGSARDSGTSAFDEDDDDYQPGSAATRMEARRKARQRTQRVLERSPRLYRDEAHQKIAGVCAGIANYYGMEVWVVRCIAVTGLLFFPSIVFPAYWIMYFVMDTPSKDKTKRRAERKARRRSRRNRQDVVAELEPDLSVSPRRNLRNVQAELGEVELRLRRMETHVTSGQYELQRELHKIEVNPPGSAASSS